MIDNYTLVIPTYNRNRELAALLRYFEKEKASFKIKILDSSEREIKDKNLNIINNLRLNIDYHEYDEDIEPFNKFRDGINKVETAFCQLCADDDIVFIDGIKKSIKYLSKNSDTVVAHGWYFMFRYKEDDMGNSGHVPDSFEMRNRVDVLLAALNKAVTRMNN